MNFSFPLRVSKLPLRVSKLPKFTCPKGKGIKFIYCAASFGVYISLLPCSPEGDVYILARGSPEGDIYIPVRGCRRHRRGSLLTQRGNLFFLGAATNVYPVRGKSKLRVYKYGLLASRRRRPPYGVLKIPEGIKWVC